MTAQRSGGIRAGLSSAGGEYLVVLAVGAAGAALVLLAAGRPWAYADVVGAPGRLGISPTGRTVAPIASGLGLFALAGMVAVVATRRLGRALVGGLLTLAGLGILAGVIRVAVDPRAAVHDAAVAAAGLTSPMVDNARLAGWPLVAAAGAALIVLSGLVTIVRGRRWPMMSGRYERATGPNARAESGPAPPPTAGPAAGQEQRFAPAKAATGQSARNEDHPGGPDPGHRAMWDAQDRGEDLTD